MAANLIGLCGLARSGKTTAAEYFVSRGLIRLSFSAPIKVMLRCIGLSEREILGDLKDVPCDALLGHTPRHAMQTLGTDWGRKMIGEDIWANIGIMRASMVLSGIERDPSLSGCRGVVFDDVRFRNEVEAIKALGGLVIRIERGGMVAGQHESEAGVKDLDADAVIRNDGDLQRLYEQCEFFLSTEAAKCRAPNWQSFAPRGTM